VTTTAPQYPAICPRMTGDAATGEALAIGLVDPPSGQHRPERHLKADAREVGGSTVSTTAAAIAQMRMEIRSRSNKTAAKTMPGHDKGALGGNRGNPRLRGSKPAPPMPSRRRFSLSDSAALPMGSAPITTHEDKTKPPTRPRCRPAYHQQMGQSRVAKSLLSASGWHRAFR